MGTISSWKPNLDYEGAPYSFNFDYEDWKFPYIDQDSIIYCCNRFSDSLDMHTCFGKSYDFKKPTSGKLNLAEIRRKKIVNQWKASSSEDNLEFDSNFESGNLDLVVKKSTFEYDLFMRSDSNSGRHHHWFYFSVKNKTKGLIKFNILNFTKPHSLFSQGMRICIFSKSKEILANKKNLPEIYKSFHRG